ncbi:MAG TPA: hypothetical protein VK765_02190 [Solirubrobacteraceae bacterium]|jgi:hypothetical protein|nr:hypothetical protein [Solirubrobacteraceae bacterium]
MRRSLTTLCLMLCAPLLAACGTAGSTSTSRFTGVKREVAQGIASLQSDAAGVEQKKVCTEDLSASVVKRLGGTKGCEAAIKRQLDQVDELEVSVQSVNVTGTTATATVKSIHEGKNKLSTLTLVKEGHAWKVSGE